MTIQLARITNIILLAIVIASGNLYYLWYIGAMHLSMEVLNRQKLYVEYKYKIYNPIFWVYELVLIERLFQHHLSETSEWLLNCAEHLGFGIIICLKIYIYTAMFGKQKSLSRWKRGLLAFSIFNIIGVFNEVFQNILGNRNLFVFTDDSVNDIKLNLLGGSIFTGSKNKNIVFHTKTKAITNYLPTKIPYRSAISSHHLLQSVNFVVA